MNQATKLAKPMITTITAPQRRNSSANRKIARVLTQCLSALAAFAVLMPAGVRCAEVRVWTSQNGRSLEAAYEGLKGNHVTLRMPDGRLVDYPLDLLSEEDRRFVASRQAMPAAVAGDADTTAGEAAIGEMHGGSLFLRIEQLRAVASSKGRTTDPDGWTKAHADLVAALNDAQLHQEALAVLDEAVPVAETRHGRASEEVAILLHSRARAHSGLGEYDQAESFCRASIEIFEKVQGAEGAGLPAPLASLGILPTTPLPVAEELLMRARRINEKTGGAADADQLSSILHNLGFVVYKQGRVDEAEALLLDALEVAERGFGENHHKLLATLQLLSTIHNDRDEYEQAGAVVSRTLDIAEAAYGADSTIYGYHLLDYVVLLVNQSRYEEADPLAQRLVSMCFRERGRTGTAPSYFENAVEALGVVCEGLGRSEQEMQRIAERLMAP